MGEDAVLHPDHKDHRVLQPLGGVHGHENYLTDVVVLPAVRQIVGVGYQPYPLQELVHVGELGGHADQLGQVLQPAFGFNGVFGPQLVEVIRLV